MKVIELEIIKLRSDEKIENDDVCRFYYCGGL